MEDNDNEVIGFYNGQLGDGSSKMTTSQRQIMENEPDGALEHRLPLADEEGFKALNNIYRPDDFETILGVRQKQTPYMCLSTLDELLERDNQREKDGFPKKIKTGTIVIPMKSGVRKVVIVPVVVEEKFVHDTDPLREDDETEGGGSGKGEKGDVIGEESADGGEDDSSRAGKEGGGEHGVGEDAYNLGKKLSEKFRLPNLQEKNKKKTLERYTYELTDMHRGSGQVLDKQETLKQIIKTNIGLGLIKPKKRIEPKKLIVGPNDYVYRVLSREIEYESQALVFFARDYSGSMNGKPTEIIVSQHVMIYSWLMYQYKELLLTRFVVHDTAAKEVPDFYTYYKLLTGGGTMVYSAFELINKIVEENNLASDYNIYVFYGTDGDDFSDEGKPRAVPALEKMISYANRVGITIVRNTYTKNETVVEKYIRGSGLLKKFPEHIRMDVMNVNEDNEERIIEGIKNLVSEKPEKKKE